MYALINCYIYTGKKILNNHALIIADNLIKNICPITQLSNKIKKYNLRGCILSPGFIDLQINGCGGVQFNDTINNISLKTLEHMQLTNQRFGCTSFLPTLITSSDVLIKQAIRIMRIFLKKHQNQALGLHLEGPYINPNKKGIHNSSLIKKATEEMIAYLCKNNDVISLITLAPEQIELSMIYRLYKSGIVVAIGHSNATYQQTKKSFKYGITLATHLFNAMPPITSRQPGVIGAIFDTQNIFCSIIADGLHVHWANIRNTKNIKKNHLILITDATAPAGANHISKFIFSNKTIYHNKGLCIDKNKTISGSSLTMIKAIKNIVKYTGITLQEALRMATLYPARVLKIDDKLGSITANKIANITIFNKKFHICKTIINGKIYNR